ncbi:MAG: hypothetical protein IJG17_09270, partial [Eubacterium sp.]|nr:hypothetical protein [Eubacterium sp.]
SSSAAANTVTLPESGSQNPWEHVFDNLPLTENGNVTFGGKTYQVQFYYKYYIEETDKPDQYETIYLDGNDNEIASADVGNLATDEADSGQTIVNRELLDVPVTKYWPDYSGDQYEWSAGFQLEYMETKVNASDEDAGDAVTEFTPVDGKFLTVNKDSSAADAKFGNLPMYRRHSNGTLYRIEYSVREMSYRVWPAGQQPTDDNVVIQWSRDGSLPLKGVRYTPQFEQDAGEHGAYVDDYQIILINTLENRTATKEIELNIQKMWPSGSDIADQDDTYAKFRLRRYVHEEYVDFSDVPVDTPWVDITLDLGSGGTQTLHVLQGRTMHIAGSVRGSVNADSIRFTQSAGEPIVYSYDNSSNRQQSEFAIDFTADQTKTVTLAEGANFVVGGAKGFRLTEMDDRNQDTLDANFSEEFVLNKQNDWQELFSHLSAIEEDKHAENTEHIIRHIFTYFIEEVESNPADYYATFKAGGGDGYLSGDENNRIYFDTSLTAENKLKPGALKITKIVKVDEAVPSAAKAHFTDGTYTFRVFEADGSTPAKTADGEAVAPVEITFSGGTVTSPSAGYALVGNLEPGTYVIKEVSIPDGMK